MRYIGVRSPLYAYIVRKYNILMLGKWVQCYGVLYPFHPPCFQVQYPSRVFKVENDGAKYWIFESIGMCWEVCDSRFVHTHRCDVVIVCGICQASSVSGGYSTHVAVGMLAMLVEFGAPGGFRE